MWLCYSAWKTSFLPAQLSPSCVSKIPTAIMQDQFAQVRGKLVSAELAMSRGQRMRKNLQHKQGVAEEKLKQLEAGTWVSH